jgi:thiol-disulfide isomerase/thioredoxin
MRTACVLGLSCFLVFFRVTFSTTQLLAGDKEADPVEVEIRALANEYENRWRDLLRALPADGGAATDSTLSDEEWLKQQHEYDAKFGSPDAEMLPRFLTVAQSHPDSPFAFYALAFVIYRGGPQTGDVLGEPWRLKEQAIDEVLVRHLEDPRVIYVLDKLSGSLPSQKTEAFFRKVMETSSDRKMRAAATLGLARYLHTLGQAHERSRKLKDKAKPLNYERFRRVVVAPYLEKNFPYDRDKTMAEIEGLLAEVQEKYADVTATEWAYSGPALIFFEPKPFPHSKNYGDLAKSMWFQLNSIAPGKIAPDIEGVDAEGKRFRLSEYRGKVVLLTFSANWCGGCVNLYPLERKVVDKFREQPFALLSVSQDEIVDTLKASIASGEITWRCWWDGLDGPIRNAWNCRGVPGIILLDHEHVIQDVLLNRFSTQEEFEAAIMGLLKKVPDAQ